MPPEYRENIFSDIFASFRDFTYPLKYISNGAYASRIKKYF